MKNTHITTLIGLLFLLLCLQTNAHAQFNGQRFKYEIGAGVSLWGHGDQTIQSFVHELDVALYKHLEASSSLVLARGVPSEKLYALSMVQLNLNLLVSPFSNQRRYCLKVGSGLSMMKVNAVGVRFGHYENGVLIADDLYISDKNLLGYNLLVENGVRLSNKHTLSVLLFAQLYSNRDTNAGGNLKLGYMFGGK